MVDLVDLVDCKLLLDAQDVTFNVTFTTLATALDDDDQPTHDWPVTYVTFDVAASAGHSVRLYLDTTAEHVVSNVSHEVTWSRPTQSTLAVDMCVGTLDQIFAADKWNDRIDWGFGHLAVPASLAGRVESAMANDTVACGVFASGVSLKDVVDEPESTPRPADDNWIVLAVDLDLSLKTAGTASGVVMLALDQGNTSMSFFGTGLAPFWTRKGASAVDMLTDAAAKASTINDEAEAFDSQLIATHSAVGGDAYATLTSLVYRQTTGAIEKVWDPLSKQTWVFMKEISSDGDVSTIDVVYPASPFFLNLYPVTLLRMLMPLLVYSNNETAPYGLDMPYNLSWAPHHLGTWPICDLAPQNQEQMPVSE